ncbi:MAG: hypothetical protein ACR2LC_07075 [Pyrinomonadaceae bacterium]
MTFTKRVAGCLCAGKTVLFLCLCSAFVFQGCARVEGVLLGRVETKIEDHALVVTDCYRIGGEQLIETVEKSAEGVTYKYVPCRDAVIFIKRGELIVNGKSYGMLGKNDAVTVDHGKVLINEREAAEIASK